MRKKKKQKKFRPRITEVVIMRLHCKPGGFIDRRKKKDKEACRKFRHEED
jgi:hypothetical protein